MKNRILILLFLAFATIAKAQQAKDFVIQGKVNKPSEGYIYFQQAINNGGSKTIDSVKLVAGTNTFFFKGKLSDDGGFYLLNFFNKQKVLVLLEGGERLDVVADGYDEPAHRGMARVDGSKNMVFYQRLMSHVEGLQTKVAAWNTDYAMCTQKNDVAGQQKIQALFQAEQKLTTDRIKALFPEMGTSLVALYAVNFLSPDEDIDFLSEVADKFAKDKPKNKQVQQFVTSVAVKKGLSIGSMAPEISLDSPEGKELSLASLRGKYVLIDFWASWCGPCRQENPNVVKMYEKYKTKGFEIYSVSLDSEKGRWLGAIKQDNLGWAHVSDLKGWQSKGAASYQVQAIPQTFLLDKDGKIIAKNLRGAALEAKLMEVLQ